MLLIDVGFCLFFFKQKTAYEMRMSDWSSDVCSSDLPISIPASLRAWCSTKGYDHATSTDATMRPKNIRRAHFGVAAGHCVASRRGGCRLPEDRKSVV